MILSLSLSSRAISLSSFNNHERRREKSVCERRKRGKKCVFEKTRHNPKEDTAEMMNMRRMFQQRGISKISKMSKFFSKSQNRMNLQNTALRYCSTESLRQEDKLRFKFQIDAFSTTIRQKQIAVLRDQIEALQHRNAIGLQRFRDAR